MEDGLTYYNINLHQIDITLRTQKSVIQNINIR